MSNPNFPSQSQNDARYATPASVASAISTQAATDTGQYAPKASPTFTGTVTLPAASPTAATQAVSKGYVDTQISNVSSAGIADGSVTTTKLADSSVTSTKIVDGTIVAADINAAAAIAASQLDSATQSTLSTVATHTTTLATHTGQITKLTLTPTTTKTSAYTASAQDLVLADATSGAFTVTVPASLADGTQIGMRKMDASANIITIVLSGSDAFSTGATSATLTLQSQGVTLFYQAATSRWIALSNNLTLSSLDARFATASSVTSAIATQATTDAATYAPQASPTFTGTTAVNGAIAFKRTTVADANYTILATDNIVEYTSLTAIRTITLPTAVGVSGKIYMIKDASNAANTYNITIATTSSQTIDGVATQTISKNYGEMAVYSDGANWRIQSRDNYYAAASTDLGTVLSGAGLRVATNSYSINTTGGISSNGQNVTGYNVIGVNAVTATASLASNGSTYLKQAIYVYTTTITANTTLTLTSTQYQLVNSASAVTVTLPTSASISGMLFTIKNINTGTVTVAGTIDGATNYTLSAQYKYVTLSASATSGVWYVVGNN